MLFARRYSSNVIHLINEGITTLCGQDAKLMARWDNAKDTGNNSDRRVYKTCNKCKALS